MKGEEVGLKQATTQGGVPLTLGNLQCKQLACAGLQD